MLRVMAVVYELRFPEVFPDAVYVGFTSLAIVERLYDHYWLGGTTPAVTLRQGAAAEITVIHDDLAEDIARIAEAVRMWSVYLDSPGRLLNILVPGPPAEPRIENHWSPYYFEERCPGGIAEPIDRADAEPLQRWHFRAAFEGWTFREEPKPIDWNWPGWARAIEARMHEHVGDMHRRRYGRL